MVSDDAEPVDRDRLDPLTLRFVDPALERDFQIATLDGARRRHRWGMFINIPLWIVGPALAIAVFPTIDPRPILIGATVMVVHPRGRWHSRRPRDDPPPGGHLWLRAQRHGRDHRACF